MAQRYALARRQFRARAGVANEFQRAVGENRRRPDERCDVTGKDRRSVTTKSTRTLESVGVTDLTCPIVYPIWVTGLPT